LHLLKPAHRKATTWLTAIVGSAVLALAVPAVSNAAVQEPLSNPNNYECIGNLKAGAPELGSEEQQVQYTISCDGPITGYQLETQIPITGVSAAPITENGKGEELLDTFSCFGEIPGFAVNCGGLAQQDWETITGEFAIGTPICSEPRVDALLTVTYAYAESKTAGGIAQAISGPFDLGRPHGCKSDAESGGDRLNPKAPVKHKAKAKAKKAKKSSHKAKKASHRK
jgi:hypothetical protein